MTEILEKEHILAHNHGVKSKCDDGDEDKIYKKAKSLLKKSSLR